MGSVVMESGRHLLYLTRVGLTLAPDRHVFYSAQEASVQTAGDQIVLAANVHMTSLNKVSSVRYYGSDLEYEVFLCSCEWNSPVG